MLEMYVNPKFIALAFISILCKSNSNKLYFLDVVCLVDTL